MGWAVRYRGAWPAPLDDDGERRFRDHLARHGYALELDAARSSFAGATPLDPRTDPAREYERVLVALRELDLLLPGADITVVDDYYLTSRSPLATIDIAALLVRLRTDHVGLGAERDAYRRELELRVQEALDSPEYRHLPVDTRRRIRARLVAQMMDEAGWIDDDDGPPRA